MRNAIQFTALCLFLAACRKDPAPLPIEGVWQSDAPPFWTVYFSDGYSWFRIIPEGYCLEYAYRIDGDTVFLTPLSNPDNGQRKQVWSIDGQTATVVEFGQDVPEMELKRLSE